MSLLDRLLRPIRTGVVSSRYPTDPPLLQSATRGLPTVEALRCTREAACVTVCPTGAITLTSAAWVVDAGRCIFCARCALACPEGAIKMHGGVMLATSSIAGLLHSSGLAPSDGASGAGTEGTRVAVPEPATTVVAPIDPLDDQ